MAKAEKAYPHTYSFLVSDLGQRPRSPEDVPELEEEEEEDTEPDAKAKHREDNTEVTQLLDNMQACVKEGDASMDRLSKIADDTTRSLKRRDSHKAFQAVKSKKKE